MTENTRSFISTYLHWHLASDCLTCVHVTLLTPVLLPDDPRWIAVRCGGVGAGEEPAAGADPEPGGAMSRSGGSAAAAGPHRVITGNLTAPNQNQQDIVSVGLKD